MFLIFLLIFNSSKSDTEVVQSQYQQLGQSGLEAHNAALEESQDDTAAAALLAVYSELMRKRS